MDAVIVNDLKCFDSYYDTLKLKLYHFFQIELISLKALIGKSF